MNWARNTNPLLLALAMLVCMHATAQHSALEAAFYRGCIWRHTPKLRIESGEPVSGLELGIRVQTLGRRSWQAWQRYPSLGVSTSRFQLGAGAHGAAYGCLPWLNIPVLRFARFSAQFRIGTGLAWVTRPYDWWKNPTQNAIGSHWNNMTQFRLSGEWRASPHIRLLLGGSFTHFSNGGAALPNFGINVPSCWAGATWSPHALHAGDYRPPTESRKIRTRRWGAWVQGGYSAVQIAAFDGPKYPIWSAAAAGYFRFNRLHQATVGVDLEQNHAIYEWGLHSALFADETSARKGSRRFAWFVGEAFFFGDLAILLQTGRYFGAGYNAFVPKKLYSKLCIRYYLPERFRFPVRPFAGVCLKAHAFTAEYISWHWGVDF